MNDSNVENKVSTATTMYSIEEIENARVSCIIKDVIDALQERGYNPIDQLAGYLMSGDPAYISSYKDARKMITSIDRSEILEVILKEYAERL